MHNVMTLTLALYIKLKATGADMIRFFLCQRIEWRENETVYNQKKN